MCPWSSRAYSTWASLPSGVRMNRRRHVLLASFLVLLGILLVAPHAHADNIAIANATACSGTPPGGTICSNGGLADFKVQAEPHLA